jgi:hypothetical protein
MNTESVSKEQEGNAVLPLVIGRCLNCCFWERQKDNEYSKNMGKCSLLSGKFIDNKNEERKLIKSDMGKMNILIG